MRPRRCRNTRSHWCRGDPRPGWTAAAGAREALGWHGDGRKNPCCFVGLEIGIRYSRDFLSSPYGPCLPHAFDAYKRTHVHSIIRNVMGYTHGMITDWKQKQGLREDEDRRRRGKVEEEKTQEGPHG